MKEYKNSDKICFYGASVTQQKNGYAVILQKELGCDVEIFGFGGMHLKDAGVCFINKVIESHPSICFIDWFSTGYNECSHRTEELLDTIIYSFTNASCKLVFLFFPYVENDNKKIFHDFCKSYLMKKEATIIDVEKITNGKYSTGDILRDGTHTNDYGSRVFADIIKESFLKIKDIIKYPKKVANTKYTDIKCLEVNKEFNNIVQLEGDCEIIGLYSILGHYSGVIKVEEKDYEKNTWDRWCLYDRDAFIFEYLLNGRITIRITNDIFDTSACKEKYDFSKVEKKLVIMKIYYIGKKVDVINITEGKEINRLCTKNELISKIGKSELILYGAGKMTEMFIQKMQNVVTPIGIAVSSLDNNPSFISEIPVKEIDDYTNYADRVLVIITVNNAIQRIEIENKLMEKGFEFFAVNAYMI